MLQGVSLDAFYTNLMILICFLTFREKRSEVDVRYKMDQQIGQDHAKIGT